MKPETLEDKNKRIESLETDIFEVKRLAVGYEKDIRRLKLELEESRK